MSEKKSNDESVPELVATLDADTWNAMTPEQKADAVATFNAEVNARRAARGLPPLAKQTNVDETEE